MKVLITTVPFGEINKSPLEALTAEGAEYLINPLNKKLNEDELIELISDIDVVIAGTVLYSKKVLDNAPNLKMISRRELMRQPNTSAQRTVHYLLLLCLSQANRCTTTC